MNWQKTLLISILVLAAGGAVTAFIFSTEPTAQRTGATKETAMLVDVARAEQGSFRPVVTVTGTVEAARDIVLSPRVSGQVVRRAPAFTPGGFVQEGDTLLQIDPADYRNRLEQSRSDLHRAQADLKLEEGQQYVARQQYKLREDSLPEAKRALVLREPQLRTARAAVEAARAAVTQARLELQRTTITAPFDAHIIDRSANVGSLVSPGDNLARLAGTETYWVAATVPLSKLRFLAFSEEGRSRGSEVRIRDRTSWEPGASRTGYLYRRVGALGPQTRMARVLIEVPEPLAKEPPMMIGAFVEARIQARELENIIRLKRDFLRKDETVWVMEDGKLRIRPVDIVFRDAEYAYISSGLEKDDRVVTTNLSTVVDGAPLRLEGADDSSDSPAEQAM